MSLYLHTAMGVKQVVMTDSVQALLDRHAITD